MKRPKILSIVTPSFNHAEFIRETLDSVITQKGHFLIDYIVMDGGSNDETVEILKEYEDRITRDASFNEYKGLKYYKDENGSGLIKCLGISFRWFSEKDDGQSDAINKGYRIAAGDYFAFLNSDDTYYPGTLEKIASFRWKRADLIYGHGMWISREGRELLTYPTFEPTKYNFVYQCTLCQPAVFMKRETFEKLGDLSTEFNVVFDFEYWMRAVFKGMKFKHIDSVLATSRFYVENKTMAQKETQVNEVPLLKKKYYTKPFNTREKQKVEKARNEVHKQTVARVNKLHELIKSGVSYEFR
jgi:glycosyltransferase involved in cell wall biosynthesis